MDQQWFKDKMAEFEKDPGFQAECALMDVTEKICEMHGQPKGLYKILFWLLQWSADKLIWREQISSKHMNIKLKWYVYVLSWIKTFCWIFYYGIGGASEKANKELKELKAEKERLLKIINDK